MGEVIVPDNHEADLGLSDGAREAMQMLLDGKMIDNNLLIELTRMVVELNSRAILTVEEKARLASYADMYISDMNPEQMVDYRTLQKKAREQGYKWT